MCLSARDEARGKEAASELEREGITARAVLLDVTDAASVTSAAEQVANEYGKLDILVNNAGIAQGSLVASELDLADLRRVYEMNFFGVFMVTKVFLPLLRKSDTGRIVNMSSGLGSLTENSDPESPYANVKPLAYNTSKAALNMMTVIFAS